METKHIIYAIAIALIAILGTAIISGALMQAISNNNTGTANNPPEPEYLNVYYNTLNKTDETTVDWGTWNVGANTANLTIQNKYTSIIQVILYITDLPPEFQVAWPNNQTYLTAGQTIKTNEIKTEKITNDIKLILPFIFIRSLLFL